MRHAEPSEYAPNNKQSITLHQAMGFDCLPGAIEIDVMPATHDCDGQGGSRVRFRRVLP